MRAIPLGNTYFNNPELITVALDGGKGRRGATQRALPYDKLWCAINSSRTVFLFVESVTYLNGKGNYFIELAPRRETIEGTR